MLTLSLSLSLVMTECDGQTPSTVERTPSVGEEMEEREEEREEGGDVMGTELEDTLKASDQKRVKRNMSSPPGINYEEDTHTEMSSVRLRTKMPVSQSMDTLSSLHVNKR